MKTSLGLPSWQPAKMSIIPARNGRMGQAAGGAPPLPLIETPELSALIDFSASAASAFLSVASYQTSHPTMGLVWAAVSVGTGMKFLHDLSKF